LSEKFFPYFFRVHFNILDTVVSTPFLGHPPVYGTCHKIIKHNLNLHSYKIIVVQELLPRDFPTRISGFESSKLQQNLHDDGLL
jgi:hypothetical protein